MFVLFLSDTAFTSIRRIIYNIQTSAHLRAGRTRRQFLRPQVDLHGAFSRLECRGDRTEGNGEQIRERKKHGRRNFRGGGLSHGFSRTAQDRQKRENLPVARSVSMTRSSLPKGFALFRLSVRRREPEFRAALPPRVMDNCVFEGRAAFRSRGRGIPKRRERVRERRLRRLSGEARKRFRERSESDARKRRPVL